MKFPVIVKMRQKIYPDVPGADYQDKDLIMLQVSPSWWLKHESCKYMLTIFVHKNNKDLLSHPTTLPPGDRCKSARKKRHAAIQEERAVAKAARPVELSVERYSDVDHQVKKACIERMQFQADEIVTDTIVTHIKVMRKNADVYKATMGEAKYNKQLVALINKMPGMMAHTTATTTMTVAVPNNENDDVDNEQEEDCD